MHTQGPAAASAASECENINKLVTLPADVHTKVLRSNPSIRSIRRARLAAPCLRGPGAQLIRRLIARRGVLPAAAWSAFPAATRLIIALDSMAVDSFVDVARQLPARLVELLVKMPQPTDAFTAKMLDLPGEELWARIEAARSNTSSFVDALVASACAPFLQILEMGITVECPALLQLLQGLPQLQHAKLRAADTLGLPQLQPEPARTLLVHFPVTLETLQLDTVGADIDVTGLAACKKLRSLSLHTTGGRLHNIGSISGCAELEVLDLDLSLLLEDLAATLASLLAAIKQLSKLHTLRLPMLQVTTSTSAWQLLCKLRPLHHLQLHSLYIDSTEHASSSITRLRLGDSTDLLRIEQQDLQAPPQQLSTGCLARLLPALQQLHGPFAFGEYSSYQLAPVLEGHIHVTQLVVNKASASYSGVLWCPLGSAAGHLRMLRVLCAPANMTQHALQDAARCAQLEELSVGVCAWSEDGGSLDSSSITQALLALMQGAARGSLRRVAVAAAWTNAASTPLGMAGRVQQRPHGLAMADVALLLRSRPAQLQELCVDVCGQGLQQGVAVGLGGGASSSAAAGGDAKEAVAAGTDAMRSLSLEQGQCGAADTTVVAEAACAESTSAGEASEGEEGEEEGGEEEEEEGVVVVSAEQRQVAALLQEQLRALGLPGVAGCVVDRADEDALTGIERCTPVRCRVGGCVFKCRVWEP